MHTKCCFRFLFKSVYITYYQSFICSSTQTFNISYYTFSVKQGTTYKRTLSFSIISKIGTIIVNWKLISNHYVCARMCVCCVCVHAPVLLHYISAISIYVYICGYIHIYTYVYMYVHTYICTRACIHTYIHIYIHIYTHTYVHTHSHIYLYSFSSHCSQHIFIHCYTNILHIL